VCVTVAVAALAFWVLRYEGKPDGDVPVPLKPNEIEPVERQLARLGCKLAPLETNLPGGVATIRYALEQPKRLAGFYLRNTGRLRAMVFQQLDDPAQSPGRLCVYPSGIVRAPDDGSGPSIIAASEGWELFEVISPAGSGAASAQKTVVHEFEVADGFMREDFGLDDGWRIVSGRWRLNKHGGGLPTGEVQRRSRDFQRAVNPFSLIGSGSAGRSGTLLYDTPASRGDSYLAEAGFYFGSPGDPSDTVARKQPIPSFLIAQGELNGYQAGFGWWAEDADGPARWSLCVRKGGGPWRVLRSWGQRPPRCTWVRVGVAIANGHVAVAMLDGRELGRCKLGQMVSGGLHIHTGPEGRKIELDDVAARPSVTREEDYGQPVYVRSRNFADKELFASSRDSVQFDHWAKAANTFIQAHRRDPVLGLGANRATLRLPLFGDFTYVSTPALPPGDYRFVMLKKLSPQTAEDKVGDFTFNKSRAGWRRGRGKPHFALQFGRRDGRFVVKNGDEWESLGASWDGPVHLAIMPPTHFVPNEHEVYSKCTWTELFERSPTDWYWHDGMFGMNARWVCQANWNFMVGQSPAAAACFSKAAYYGDQEIECFMSLRSVLPAERQYYIRRDLCVSLCTDGRNLDSGYALIFGAERNRRTVLLKRGEEIASTTDPRFLFPKDPQHQNVHWVWWNLDLKKADGRFVVKLNGDTIFDIADPEPIDGGHVAFWTVGNAFVVSRINAAAQRRVERPEVALFEWPEEKLIWEPLYPDAVITRQTANGVEVSNPGGGGTFAVRTHTQADLSKTPIMEMPMRLDPDAKVNLHLEINGRPWLVRIAAPVQDMEYLLTPTADREFQFGRPVIRGARLNATLLGDATPEGGILRVDLGGMLRQKGVDITGVKQITLTVGNSSNASYLLAGFGGNHAGSTYSVGEPKWTAAQQ